MTVLGALGVEEGTRRAGGPSLEEERGPVACVEEAEGDKCGCSQVADRQGPSWVAGRWMEEAGGLGVERWVAGRREGDRAA